MVSRGMPRNLNPTEPDRSTGSRPGPARAEVADAGPESCFGLRVAGGTVQE